MTRAKVHEWLEAHHVDRTHVKRWLIHTSVILLAIDVIQTCWPHLIPLREQTCHLCISVGAVTGTIVPYFE